MSTSNWQRRWHPLLQEWVLISANTQARPVSQGGLSKQQSDNTPEHDPKCYLCPGNTRASGNTNPDYQNTFVFDNDFPSLSMDAPESSWSNPLEKSDHLKGACRVICFDPKHNTALAELPSQNVVKVFKTKQEQWLELSKIKEVENILIFENKGKESGASNPHPHGQIYATPFVPKNIQSQDQAFEQYYQENNRSLLCDIITNEQEQNLRIVHENEDFIAFVPYFARFAYECILAPKLHTHSIAEFSNKQLNSLAEIYTKLMTSYDLLFDMPFPNIISWINPPCPSNDKESSKDFHCYLSFCPPLRAPNQVKFLAGFENAGGNIVNPVQPELAAQALRQEN